MKTIKDQTFNTGFLSKLTDEPTRFENCIFAGPDDEDGITADVADCEIVNCVITDGESLSAHAYLETKKLGDEIYCATDIIS